MTRSLRRLALTLICIGGCGDDQAANIATANGMAHSPNSPTPSQPRISPPLCRFTTSTDLTLEDALDGSMPLPTEAITFPLTWTDEASAWTGAPVDGQTQARLEVVLSSVNEVETHVPGPGVPDLCQRRVEFDAGVALRIGDGAVDSHGTATFTVWPTRIDVEFILATEPAQAEEAGVQPSMRGRFQIASGEGQSMRFVLVGHLFGTRIGPTGNDVPTSRDITLAATPVAPEPAFTVPGSLTEAAWRRTQESPPTRF